ncbi:MAG: hypothetical protein ACJATL_001055 [Rickettsiales bacterium]|jgi:hypothetical protein
MRFFNGNKPNKIPQKSTINDLTVAKGVKMVPEHMGSMSKLHEANNSVVIYRPFNKGYKEMAGLMETLGKLMSIKNKSSAEKSIVGVTLLASLSKINNDEEKVRGFQERGDLDFNKSTLKFYKIILDQILKNSGLEGQKLPNIFTDSRFSKLPLGKKPEEFEKIIFPIISKFLERLPLQGVENLNPLPRDLLSENSFGLLQNSGAESFRTSLLFLASKSPDPEEVDGLVDLLNGSEIASKTNSKTDGSFPFQVTKLFLSIPLSGDKQQPFDNNKELNDIWKSCQHGTLANKEAIQAFNKIAKYCLKKGIIKEGDVTAVEEQTSAENKDESFYGLVGLLSGISKDVGFAFDAKLFTDMEYDLFVAKSGENIQCKNGDPAKPLLYMKVPRSAEPGQFDVYLYDKDSEEHSLVSKEDVARLTLENIEMFSYSRFGLNNGVIIESALGVTADYDELSGANQTVFPAENHTTEDLVSILRKLRVNNLTDYSDEDHDIEYIEFHELLSKFESGKKLTSEDLGCLADKMVEIEDLKRIELSEEEYYRQGLGVVNEKDQAYIAAAKNDSKGNVVHGRETGNLFFTEQFVEGKHLALLPDGTKRVLNNEKEICAFINEQRQKGYLVPVNPKWGWEVDGKGTLSVPEQRIDLEEVEKGLKKLYSDAMKMDGCEVVKKIHKADGELEYLRYSDGSSRDVKKAVMKYNQQKAIYELYLEVQREETSPRFVFGDVKDGHKTPKDKERFGNFNKKDLQSLKNNTVKGLESKRQARLNEESSPEIIQRFQSLQGLEFLGNGQLETKGLKGFYSEMNDQLSESYNNPSLISGEGVVLSKKKSTIGIKNKAPTPEDPDPIASKRFPLMAGLVGFGARALRAQTNFRVK